MCCSRLMSRVLLQAYELCVTNYDEVFGGNGSTSLWGEGEGEVENVGGGGGGSRGSREAE